MARRKLAYYKGYLPYFKYDAMAPGGPVAAPGPEALDRIFGEIPTTVSRFVQDDLRTGKWSEKYLELVRELDEGHGLVCKKNVSANGRIMLTEEQIAALDAVDAKYGE